MSETYYSLVPAGTTDVYAAGFDGNKFASMQEARDAVDGLRAVGSEFDHDWDVVEVRGSRIMRVSE